MAINWNISQQPHGYFVSTQRPIVLEVKVTGATIPAFFRGILWIEEFNQGGNWVNTGVSMNGYSDTDNGVYSFNIAEYCRQYFREEPAFYTQAWCSGFDRMMCRTFKLEMFPVEYQLGGGLSPSSSNNKFCKQFMAIPTNTTVEESNSTSNDYIRMDKYVMNGTNGSQVPWTGSGFNRFTTNMPAYNTIDVSQGFYFFLPLCHKAVNGRIGEMFITNSSGVTMTVPCLSSTFTRHVGIHIHPFILQFWLDLSNGPNNHLYDNSGNLTSTQMNIRIKYNNSTTGAFIRSGPRQDYKLMDSRLECSDSQGTNFVFRNMLGGFDFFRATGTESKEITMSGTEFDKHTDFRRSETTNFGVVRGQHNTTNLWGTRNEVISVFSQPLSREQVKWIEEMIMSPQVWITIKVSDFVQDEGGELSDMGLTAINIIKGSYKLYSTDRNRSFIEFKYKFSESTLTQKM